MRLLTLKIQNFMSYRSAYLQINDLGLAGIEGQNNGSGYTSSNGAGKSTLVEAIVWCLFGDTIRTLKDKDEVVNRFVGKDCSVEVVIEHQGMFYQITRFRKHTKFGNSLDVYQAPSEAFPERVNISRANVVDTQEYLNHLFGIEYQSFINAIIFGQGDVKHFSQATDAERKTIFEKLLNLEIYSRCLEVTKKYLTDAENILAVILRDLDYINKETESLDTEVKNFTEKDQTYETDKQSRLTGLNSILVSLKDSGDPDEIQKQIDQLEMSVKDFLNKKFAAQDNFNTKISELRVEQGRINSEISQRTARIQKLFGLKAQCPTCESDIDPARVQGIVVPLQTEVKKLEEDSKSLEENKNTFTQTMQEKIRNFDIEIKNIQEKLMTLRTELSRCITNREKIKNTENQIAELKDATSPYKALIESKANQCSGLAQKRQEKEALRKSKEILVAQLKFWVNGFGLKGIKSLILEDVMATLNERLDYYSRKLTNGEIQLSITTTSALKGGGTSEKLDLVVDNRTGGASYNSNSGGERRRVDACILFALQDLAMQRSSPCNVLFVDDIFDVLDEVGVEILVMQLWDKVHTTGLETILVLTPNNAVLKALPSTFKVVKEKGFSRLA